MEIFREAKKNSQLVLGIANLVERLLLIQFIEPAGSIIF